MNLSLCQRSCLYAVVVVWLTLTGTENFSLKDANDNYPSKSDKPKPCTRLKNTITYQQPICVSNGQGGFDGKSEENCKGQFKDTCPEFNEASCEMYTLESGSHKSCCRLKYYAKKSTWMEIYYTMQYDNNTLKGKPVNNIIEIHRFIKKDEYFPNRNQPDFPDSVINSNGDRGLKWIIVNKANISQPTPNVTNLCQEDKLDERCTSTGSIFNYTSENYPKGFEPIRNYIKVSADERNETVSLSFRCITVVDEGVVLPACQVLYTRRASTPGRPDTGFIYLEANIYVNPYYVNKSKEMNLRYAYWSEETPEMRDKIFTGGCCGHTKKVTVVGGWVWAWWMVTDVQRISLEVMTLIPVCEDVETLQGVPVTITGSAHVKVMKAEELIRSACEQFLGKSKQAMEAAILHTLEGHLRAILGTLTVEEVVKDRDQFAALVREVAAPDVGRMGIEIISFTIGEVRDSVQYLQSLGKAATASVKRDADVGVALASRDAGIREADCDKSAMDIKYSTDSKIESNSRLFKMQKATFDSEISTAKAESELAYELQAAKLRQKIRGEEILISVVERKKQVEVEAEEIQRRERELTATVKLPAEAECYRLETLAEAKKIQTIELAKAEASKIRSLGQAEATAQEVIGRAEADRMKLKAHVFKQYGDAAVMALVLDALPKIAAEVAAPLAKTEEIVILGGNDHVTNDLTRLVAQLPPAVQALTGVDLSKVLSKIPGAKV